MNPSASAVRRAALLTGPAAVLSLLLLFGALAVHGDSTAALSRSALGVSAAALGLASTVLLLVGLAHLALSSAQLHAAPVALLVAATGTALLVGGAWAQLIVLPALAQEAPRLADQGTGLVTAGYVISFLVAGAGWLLVGLRLRRDDVLPRGPVRVLLAGAVLMLAPLPARWFVLAVGVSLLARHRARVVAPEPAPVLR